MKPNTDALKKAFKEGRHAQAVAQCEALCGRHPGDAELKRLCANMHALMRNYGRALELLTQIRNPAQENPDILFNIALCERELKNFSEAGRHFSRYTERFPDHPDGWAGLAECRFQLGAFEEGIASADQALRIDDSALTAWTVRGNCQKAVGRFEEALASFRRADALQPTVEGCLGMGLTLLALHQPAPAVESFTRALALAPELAAARVARGDAFQGLGRLHEATADYRAALALAPEDDATLKKATLCLLEAGEGEQALELCRTVRDAQPASLTARLGEQWVLSQLVPIWHVPMMNEPERNQAFHDALQRVVKPDSLVFEIGTGSGLLAMMAARLGAQRVVTCEAVGLIAATARRIVQQNGHAAQITVLAKPSHAVRLGADLPERADVLLHEIFSSELLGEHVLPAIEDARQRLLKPGGVVLPAAASIMIALVSGQDLGSSLHAAESFGFDLREFNTITPRKRPLYREDLAPTLLSGDVEAFRFDFAGHSNFPAERKRIEISATGGGLCYGLIQWIRIEMGEGIHFENHPSTRRAVSNWQHTIYGFDEPLRLAAGDKVAIDALHDRARPWFERVPQASGSKGTRP